MLIKKKFHELSLTSSASQCTQCGVRHDITNPIDQEGVSGARCGFCAEYLWMPCVRYIYSSPKDPSLTVEARVAIVKQDERNFFATLPPCPHCKRHGWEAFHQAYKYPPDCRNCGKTFESGTFRVNTESRRDETAYWYEY